MVGDNSVHTPSSCTCIHKTDMFLNFIDCESRGVKLHSAASATVYIIMMRTIALHVMYYHIYAHYIPSVPLKCTIESTRKLAMLPCVVDYMFTMNFLPGVPGSRSSTI